MKPKTVYFIDYTRGIVLKGAISTHNISDEHGSVDVFIEDNVEFSERHMGVRTSEIYYSYIDANNALTNYLKNVINDIKSELNNLGDILGLLLKYDTTTYHHKGTAKYFSAELLRTAVKERLQELGIHVNYDFNLMKII